MIQLLHTHPSPGKSPVDRIFKKDHLSREDILYLLSLDGEDAEKLFRHAAVVRLNTLGNKVYLRGLIELSNVCSKNCRYCGIRKDNKNVERYTMPVAEVIETARQARKNGFSSLVLQSGELSSRVFTRRVASIIRGIRDVTDGGMHITLSCGEQSPEVYQEWLESGAHRYLMRIETSDRELYRFLHPADGNHCQNARLSALESLRYLGYQTGSGVMIGLPFQKTEDLARDLEFMRDFNIDMVGMGPYVEEPCSPLYLYKDLLKSKEERFFMTRKMVAVLRMMMPDINIAATTASEAIVPGSREILISTGANVIMPNVTPLKYQDKYALYEDKPDTYYNNEGIFDSFSDNVRNLGYKIVPGEWGDPLHFVKHREPATFSPQRFSTRHAR